MAPIDVHVHPPTKEYLVDAGGKYLEAAFKYFRLPFEIKLSLIHISEPTRPY